MSGEEDTDAAEIAHTHEDEETRLIREDEVARKRLLAERKEQLRRKQAEALKAKREENLVAAEPAGEVEPVSKSAPTQVASEDVARPKPAAKVIREDQVQNAVNFLNHAKVKSSALGKKIAFLEHKGLNDDEITEALKRANISSEDIKQAMESSEPTANSAAATQNRNGAQGMKNRECFHIVAHGTLLICGPKQLVI